MTQKEKLEEAKILYKTANADQRYVLESLFPELNESEDKKIWKELIHLVKKSHEQGGYALHKYEADRMLTWLEKQGMKEQDERYEHNVEPMFKIGDWVVINGFILKILGVCSDLYETTFLQSGEWRIYDMYVLDNNAHLWSIQDAKDGDVLVASDGSLFIFAKVKDNSAYYYFSLCKNGSKEISDGNHAWETANSCHPATKEQRDFLFQEIRKAGYKWDKEKKELKMIEKHTPKSKRR